MALISCSECGHSISEHAKFCTLCGSEAGRKVAAAEEPEEEGQGERARKRGSWKGILLLILGCFASCVAISTINYWVEVFYLSPERVLERDLREEPSVPAVQKLLGASRSSAQRVVGEWSQEKRDSWRVFVAENRVAIFGHKKAKDICRQRASLEELALWPGEETEVKRACAAYEEQEKALQGVQQRNREKESDYRRAERAVESARSQLEGARSAVRFQGKLRYYFQGYIHGRLSDEYLEVSEVIGGIHGGQRYALRTTETSFTTTGRFKLYVMRGGEVPVTLKNGRSVTWIELIETDGGPLIRAEVAATSAAQKLIEAERNLRNTPRPRLESLEPFEKRVEEAEKKVLASLRNAPRSTPNITSELATEKPAEKPLVQHQPEAQEEHAPTVFVPMRESRDRSAQREILGALCDVREMDGELRCARCPTGFSGEGSLKLEKAYVGQMKRGGPRYAILGVEGCDRGWNFRKGTVLLEEKEESWRVVERRPELNTADCGLAMLDEQQVLICQDVEVGQGSATTYVNAIWADGGLKRSDLFSFEDHEGACQYAGDFSTKLDDWVLADVTGEGAPALLALMTVKNGRYLLGSDQGGGDGCDDLTQGRVYVQQRKVGRAFQWQAGRFRELTLAGKYLPEGRLREYFTDQSESGELPGHVEKVLDFAVNSERAKELSQRRLAALRHSENLRGMEAEVARAAGLFPADRDAFYIELGEAAEEAGDYEIARAAYEALLATPDLSTRGFGRAAWFFATAPGAARDLPRAREVLARAKSLRRYNGVAAIAEAEVLLRQGDRGGARALLQEFLKKNRSDVAREALAELEAGTRPLQERPRELVPKRTHLVPREWRLGIPAGDLTAEERLFALELEAIEHRNKKRYAQAEALYWEALSRATGTDEKRRVRLGLGRLLEAARRPAEALQIYEAMLKEEPKNPDVLNRLAWTLLTVEPEELRDRPRARQLALQAVELTERNNPSILDTLAEAYIQEGLTALAKELLERCVALDPKRPHYQQRLEGLGG